MRESVSQSVAIIESSAGAESAEHGLARENARARDRFQRTDANMSVDELGRTAQLFWLNLCAHFSHS